MATLPKHKSIIGSEITCGAEPGELPSFVEFSKMLFGVDPTIYPYQEWFTKQFLPSNHKGKTILISTPRIIGQGYWKQFMEPAFFFKHELKEKTTKELLIMRLTADLDKQIYIKEELSKRDLKSIARNQNL